MDLKNSKHLNFKRDFNALSFRLHSSAVLKCNEREQSLGDGALVFIPANVRYSRFSEQDELIVVHFLTDSRCFNELEIVYPGDTEEMARLFLSLNECWERKAPGYTHQALSLFYSILSIASAEKSDGHTHDSPALDGIRPSIDFIHSNYSSPTLTAQQIARASYVSDSYLRRVFKAHLGVSPWQYVLRLRIDKAKKLIIAGYHSISEIAQMCGFNDTKYFSSEFKRLVGISPSKYKY